MSKYAVLDDKKLLSLLKTDDNSAFAELYGRYWQKLFSVAANKLKNISEAQELVQDIFLDIWNRRNELDVTSTLSAYLSVALKYKIINLLAKKSKEMRYAAYAKNNLSISDISTEQLLSFDELKERLAKHVAELPDKCRLVYTLSREQGLSRKAIALQLGISEKTVESHLTKALKRLRIGLGNFFSFFL